MNIFFLDSDPRKAAEAMCNKHVIKMILESAQLLCTAHHLIPIWKDFPDKFYKATHINHPCAIWVRQCSGNYCWLSQHASYLCKEYTYRYDKIHASQSIIKWCNSNIAADVLNFGNILAESKVFGYGSDPPQCMPEEYKCNDTVQAYRNYYLNHKRHTMEMKWTRRSPPEWWNEA